MLYVRLTMQDKMYLERSDGVHELYTDITKQKRVGVFEVGLDGYYVFWPESGLTGYYNEYLLGYLLSVLKELNQEWDKVVQAEIGARVI